VHRWLDKAGRVAQKTVDKQLDGIPTSGQLGTDGLWSRLRGKTKKVVLVLVDSLTGIVWPVVVVDGEESTKAWGKLFERARQAGLDWDSIRGVTSDGASGLVGYLASTLSWVNHQRCVFHLWRNLSGELAERVEGACEGLVGKARDVAKKRVRKELVGLVRGVLDAPSEGEAQRALERLRSHKLGRGLAEKIEEHLESALVHLLRYNEGLMRVAPEWVWRDYRQRLSRGKNHGSDVRLERASLVWGVYQNFTPAQWRCERKRRYRRAGKSPLEMAGVPPGDVSYLDALSV
jgi:hypothetical protein